MTPEEIQEMCRLAEECRRNEGIRERLYQLIMRAADAADALEVAEKRANEVTELLLNANSKLHTQGDYIVSLESKLKELEKQLEGAREAWAIAETNGRILASTVRGTTDASWATYRAIFSEPQIDAERIGYRVVPVLIVPQGEKETK